MSAGSKDGKDFTIKLGAAQILGIGDVSINGQQVNMNDDSEFGDKVKMFKAGIRDGGQVSISGLYKPADATGQTELRKKFINGEDIDDLRVYIDDTSFMEPNQTTGYLSPGNTTGNDTVLSHVNVQSHEMSGDKGGLAKWSAAFKVSGDMVLV